MKQTITLSILILLCNAGYAQSNGKIAGQVTLPHSSAVFATVQVMGTDHGATTDENGEFSIDDIPTGKVTVLVKLMGYQPAQKTVTVVAGQTTKVDFQLKEDNLNLNEVVISATRYELDRKEAPVVVNVLSPKLFNATQSVALSEGLNYQPGVRVETNCQNCGFTQVRLNGLEGAYSQILINSRSVFSALNSVYGLDQIPTNIIERVEVVRGGGSALYGSNAIGGTINIITKEPVENTWQIGSNISLIDGTTPDNSLNFNGSLTSEDLHSGVTFHGLYRQRGSYDANGDSFTEITRLENNTFGMKAFLKPSERSKLSLDFSAIKEYRRGGDQLDLPPHFTDITEELTHNTIIGGVTYEQFSEDSKNHFSVYLSGQKTQRDSYYGGLGGGRTAADSALATNAYGKTNDLSLVAGSQFSRNFSNSDVVIFGAEYQRSDVEDEIIGYQRLIDQSVNTVGFYGQYEWRPSENMTLLAGGRYDHTFVDGFYKLSDITRSSDISTGVFSPRINLLYDLRENLQLRLGYARGFRAPQAFNEDLHISSVGGEPTFVILSDGLKTELSDAYTTSLNLSENIGDWQFSFLAEGFYTLLKRPFTTVSTGATLPNGSILEEVRNGAGAEVRGGNFELSLSPSSRLVIQAGGTLQQSTYKDPQVLFEPEIESEEEPTVTTDQFLRSPNAYGYLSTNLSLTERLGLDLTGAYTGPMMVPHVISESGFMDLVDTQQFFDANIKLSYHFDLAEGFHLEIAGGVQNVFNSYQTDFDTGALRDSNYIYGPAKPQTFFFGVKIGDFH
ncbi:TonB-dependent receptor [Echinicola strongylocentroti]|uniref:TonB-dependent receptor n=1 Tax=Echinicola strongylocentroti TaxID=1795355 RepID=A0A2Z4IE32_9BACT|nr:TonB-dependent receptor [Echinicola strongylocentroti]AWW29322.1 TonB-dependent receptor [Echinicola strongylocentroti]